MTENLESPHGGSSEQRIGEFLKDTWGSVPAARQQVQGSSERNFSDWAGNLSLSEARSLALGIVMELCRCMSELQRSPPQRVVGCTFKSTQVLQSPGGFDWFIVSSTHSSSHPYRPQPRSPLSTLCVVFCSRNGKLAVSTPNASTCVKQGFLCLPAAWRERVIFANTYGPLSSLSPV